MIRALVVLLIIAIAAFFTRPDEAKMRAAADEMLQNPQTIGQGIDSAVATFAADRQYDNYYVAAGYGVSVGREKIIQCWGAFTMVKCDRVAAQAGAGASN